uniref:Thyroglobulin n=1 Tax=Poecilia latipinna TaxID=48699 RepID=A0A3B3VM33_9TELE
EALSRCEILRSVAVGTKQEEVPHCLEDGSFSCPVPGPTPCQLQSLLQCAPSGLFEPVQCDSRGRCWCVDQDGMELYGTRQASIPRRCPSSCEVRSRRLLHSSASSPPQCAADGSFLPVQCKFINTTDRTELDLVKCSALCSSSPEAFETFRNFRKFFPLVSSYCFCSDSRGRELQGTGVELLMSEVYDSAFSGPRSAHSFAQTNIYRVLQRRMLGVRLALSGHFRCPSPCEEERRAALESSSVFVPSCEADGRFSAKQCQQGALCWCVDPTGRELTGTRRPGDGLVCGEDELHHLVGCCSRSKRRTDSPLTPPPGSGPADCPAQRRLALSQLFSGLVRPPQASSGSATLCLSLLRPLRVLGYSDPTSFLSRLVEVLQGLFPSVGGALEALTRSPAQRLQENLFGGKFLQNVAAFNYTGVLGPRGAVGVDQLSAQSLQENRDLVRAVSRALEDPAFLSALRQTLMVLSGAPSGSLQQVLAGVLRSCSEEEDDSSSLFVPRCSLSGGYQPVQCRDAECWCVNLQGQEAPGSRTAGWPPRCPTSCEMARANAMKVKSNMAAGAEIHIPACSEDGDFLPLQCVGDRCFCVDAEGRKMAAGPTGGAVTCEFLLHQNVSDISFTFDLSGRCSKALAEVTAFRQEVDSLVFLSNSTHLPVGYGFLLAKGLSLSQSEEELQLSQSEELKVSERLLSRSRSALRLAASSSELQRHKLQEFNLKYQMYLQITLQKCWCVDEEGEFIPGSLRRSLRLPRCRSRCQRAEAHSLLSDWMKASDITTASPYHPQCEQGGSVNSVLPSGPSWCELQRLRCRPDGSFDPLQCDVTSCWCVSEDGQEMAGTRSLRQTGRTPSCDRPLCPAPNITHGALVCHPAADGRQSCDLVCHHGYQNSLPVSSFLCSIKSRQWDEGDKPLSGACQSESVRFYFVLFIFLLPSGRSVALCGDSAVGLWCDAGDSVRLTLRWTADLSDLTTSDLPHLHHMGEYSLNRDSNFMRRFVPAGLRPAQAHGSIVSFPVVCPAGSFYQQGVCLLCPQGTYQELEGRDFCTRCPRGSSPAGASAANQCETDCERRGLRCSQSGDFLLAQPNFLSGGWRCVSNEGVELEWTSREERLTDEECSGEDQFGPGSGLGCERPVFVSACAVEPSCHHVALFDRRTRCDLYSSLNAVCSASQQVSRLRVKGQPFRARILLQLCVFLQATGFLGNPRAERFHQLRCSLRVRGGASDLFVLRKNGAELQHQSFVRMRMRKAVSGVFRTQVFSSRNTSLSDVRRFCQDGCSRDACCHGFILNQNVLDGGSLLCGWLRAPSVLMCEDEDWDVIGQGPANRICGAGLSYSKQQRSFEFDFGGEKFTISKKATQLGLTSPVQTQTECSGSVQLTALCLATAETGRTTRPPSSTLVLSAATVQLRFQSLSSAEVLVDPQRKQPVLSFWLSKNDYSSQNALLWCLTRMQLSVLTDSDRFFRCALYPDTRVCGGYDQPIRRSCRPLLDRATNNTYSKKVDLSGPVQSFYERVPFQKMVSYSVRNRPSSMFSSRAVSVSRFRECERRCDEDPCCRGFGFVHETKSRGLLCLPLISLGVLTCSEDDASTWRTQDCSPPEAETSPEPFGWYQKPGTRLTQTRYSTVSVCVRPESVSVFMDDWRLLSESSLLIDASLSTYDVIHVSRDIDTDRERTRDWCLHADEPITEQNRAWQLTDPNVFLERSPQAASISVPGHGTLQGVAMETAVGSDRRTVIRFLGVPYARPPIGVLRFEAAQLADWTGTWDATNLNHQNLGVRTISDPPVPSSEDCLYLNIFTPAVQVIPVLVYFFNPPANQNQNLLDGSALAALGNIVVVTASYRTAALGFLTAGGLHGNYGLSDQEAALRWVHAHISLVGGDSGSVTVGAERRGADISSLTLLSSSPPFHRMILMGGSVFSPSLVQTASAGRRQAVDLARELGCVTSDLSDDGPMVACLRSTPVHKLNAAQTKVRVLRSRQFCPAGGQRSVPGLGSGPQVRVRVLPQSGPDAGHIRTRRPDQQSTQDKGQRSLKTAFYEALSRSLGGASGNALLKDAAAWFYSLDHDPSAAGYNLFSRALNNATRDLFIICPTVQMALHWAASGTNIFQYHQPASTDVLVPLDVQFLFGIPLQPMNSQRFTSSDRRLSLAVMTYASSFIRTGNPNPSHVWAESVLPRWQPVTAEAPPTYLELSPALQHQQGLRQNACSFWRELGTRLTSKTGRFC